MLDGGFNVAVSVEVCTLMGCNLALVRPEPSAVKVDCEKVSASWYLELQEMI